MTLEHHIETTDLFGLAGTFPRPAWVVLDAARDQRFTGELVFDTDPQVRVYVDRGRIYVAERATDSSLGSRLVDAGAVSAAQLEHGSLRVGDDEHLGRLFERVPSIDRHTVLITAELMTEECVSWLAHQRVDEVESMPYRHHPSGVHRWQGAPAWGDLMPGDPLPAPDPSQVPVELASPEPLFAPEGSFTDDMIQWDEPSWLDERLVERSAESFPSPSSTAHPVPIDIVDRTPASGASADWPDRLDSDEVPAVDTDPLASSKQFPPLPAERSDRFEVIWPSGEVDAQFDESYVAGVDDRHPDMDRAGPTARVARSAAPTGDAPTELDEHDEAGHAVDAGKGDDATGTSEATDGPHVDAIDHDVTGVDVDDQAPDGAVDERGADERDTDEQATDDVVLAVRRAVAAIETGSLSTRRGPADTPVDDESHALGAVPPGRVALRGDGSDLALGVAPPPNRSVFDDLQVAGPPMLPSDQAGSNESAVEQPEPPRTSALRRLIGSLRRR